jgi:hypothetical protein
MQWGSVADRHTVLLPLLPDLPLNRTMRALLRSAGIAVWLSVMTALFAGPALAGNTGNGSKNFSAPNSVPNYFSNEAGPMIGGAAESRRGELYPGQAAASPPQPAAVAAVPQIRQRVAMAVPRGPAVRGRGTSVVAHHVAVHGRSTARVVAQGKGHSHVVYASSRTSHTATKTTRVSNTHHHARG